MSIADLVVEQADVEYNGSVAFSVRGLSLVDIAALLEQHQDQVKKLFTDEGSLDFVDLIANAPEFVSGMICLAANEVGQEKKVMLLPAGVQLDAITQLWGLTAISGEDLGNVLQALVKGATQMASSVQTSAGAILNESVNERAARLLGGATTPAPSLDTQSGDFSDTTSLPKKKTPKSS